MTLVLIPLSANQEYLYWWKFKRNWEIWGYVTLAKHFYLHNFYFIIKTPLSLTRQCIYPILQSRKQGLFMLAMKWTMKPPETAVTKGFSGDESVVKMIVLRGQRMRIKSQRNAPFTEMTSNRLISQQKCAFCTFEMKNTMAPDAPEIGTHDWLKHRQHHTKPTCFVHAWILQGPHVDTAEDFCQRGHNALLLKYLHQPTRPLHSPLSCPVSIISYKTLMAVGHQRYYIHPSVWPSQETLLIENSAVDSLPTRLVAWGTFSVYAFSGICVRDGVLTCIIWKKTYSICDMTLGDMGAPHLYSTLISLIIKPIINTLPWKVYIYRHLHF